MGSKYFGIFILFLFACKHEPSNVRVWKYPSQADLVSKFIFDHEKALNADLDFAIHENFQTDPGNPSELWRTNTWAGYDSALHNQNSGPYPHVRQLVDIVRDIDTCLQVEYSFSRDTSAKKTITIYKDFGSPCLIGIDSIFSGWQTTEHFDLRREKGLVRHQTIPAGHFGLDAHRVRFAVSGKDSLKDIIIYANSLNPDFEPTAEVQSQLPLKIFGRYFLNHRVRKVIVKNNSAPGEKLLTINGLAKIVNATQ